MRLSPALLLLLALLAGCASTPQQGQGERPWREHRNQVEALQQWQARGKLALRNGQQAQSATLLWQQRGGASELQLSGPLGMAATRILADGQTLEIHRGDEVRVLDISTPRAITLNTGWDLPLAALPYWLRGIPQPGTEGSRLHVEQGLLRSLSQDGWKVRFDSYARFGNYTLPTRLQVQRQDTSVKLLLNDWRTGSTP
ncbi:MAG: lipoprotein insertase outer membrane protein LolB [Parahaliea sp.]